MNANTRRERIFIALDQALEDFLITGRKEDRVLPLGEIEQSVRDWDVTIAEMTQFFSEWMRARIPVPNVGDDTIEEPELTGKSWTVMEEDK